jgi:hypothetical protein
MLSHDSIPILVAKDHGNTNSTVTGTAILDQDMNHCLSMKL